MGGYQVQKLQGSLNSCSYRQEKLSACFSSFGTTFLGKTDLFKCYASHDACRLSFVWLIFIFQGRFYCFGLHRVVLILNKFGRVAFGSKIGLDSWKKVLLKITEGLEIVGIRVSCLHGWANSLSASVFCGLSYSLSWGLESESGFSFSLQVRRWFRNSLIAIPFVDWGLDVILLKRLVQRIKYVVADWCPIFGRIALPCDFNLYV